VLAAERTAFNDAVQRASAKDWKRRYLDGTTLRGLSMKLLCAS
jgi:hypothetical protein